MEKKDKKMRFYWNQPPERIQKKARGFFAEPFEFRVTFPQFSFPETRRQIRISIGQSDKEMIIKAELPGFQKEEIQLNIQDNVMTVSAQRKKKNIEKSADFYREEFLGESVSRWFTLPKEVNTEKSSANLDHGILTIVLPKKHPGKKKGKNIDIK